MNDQVMTDGQYLNMLISAIASSSPTIMANAATVPPIAPTPTIAATVPAISATPTLSPSDAEKLKEVTTYRNEDFGFAFQYPKYERSSYDGRLMEVQPYRKDPPWGEWMPLELRLLGVKLDANKKSADFLTLRAYIDENNRELEQQAEEDDEPPCLEQRIQSIQVAGRDAFLEECVYSCRSESVIYIEAKKYVYHLYFLGHLNEPSDDQDIQQGLQFVPMLLETWTDFEEGHK